MLAVLRVVFGLVLLVKAVDIAARANDGMQPTVYLPMLTLWLLASTGMIVGVKVRPAATLIIVLTLALIFVPRPTMYSHHLFLIISICAILLLPYNNGRLLRLELTVVYGFATLAKINESFLSGTVIHEAASVGPLGSFNPESFALLATVAGLAVLTEGFLAVGFWFDRTRRLAVVLGVGLHVGMMVMMSSGFVVLVQLVVYAGLMFTLYLSHFEVRLDQWRNSVLARSEPYVGTDSDRTVVPAYPASEGVLSG